MNSAAETIFDQYPGRPFIWLDYTAYAARLLADDQPPWGDATALIAWYREAQALLRSDVVTLPVGELVADALRRSPDRAAVSTPGGAAQLLGRVLGDDALRKHAAAVVRGLRAVFANLPLVLRVPSPAASVRWVLQNVGPAGVQAPDEDAIDTAAVVIADFLRSFANEGLDGVLVDELGDEPPPLAEELYLPLLNVAQHYQWLSGWRRSGAGRAGFDFTLGVTGDIEETDWQRVDGRPQRPRYLVIPRDAVPESVLETLEAQR